MEKVDGSLRVKMGMVIKVNDEGETITIPVEDPTFINRFYELLDSFYDAKKDIAANMEGKNRREQNKYIATKMEGIKTEIDKTFGKDCCKKVFGENVVPSSYAVAEFLEQLNPIVKKYVELRTEYISKKYRRRRRGHN